jgi:hypothetical protein
VGGGESEVRRPRLRAGRDERKAAPWVEYSSGKGSVVVVDGGERQLLREKPD